MTTPEESLFGTDILPRVGVNFTVLLYDNVRINSHLPVIKMTGDLKVDLPWGEGEKYKSTSIADD